MFAPLLLSVSYADKRHLEWMIRNGNSNDENPQQKNPKVVKSNMKKLYEMVRTTHTRPRRHEAARERREAHCALSVCG